MKSKILNHDGARTYVVALETGDSLIASLTRFAREERLAASEFTAIGALAWARLAYFNWETKAYDEIPVDEQVEVLSLVGDIALDGNKPKVHAHAVLGRRDGSTVGGHLLEATVRPTLEVLLIDSPGYLRRLHDANSGIALIRLDA